MYRSEGQIKKDMLSNIKNTVDKTQNSLIHDALSPASIELAIMYINLEEVAKKIDVENLFEDELERFVNQRTGIMRKQATKGTTVVLVSGIKGAKIKKGDLFGSDTVNFISLENRTVDDTGFINVLVECEDYGSIGNVPVAAINYFPVSIPGLINVTNDKEVKNGYDAESDYELRQRYYERIRTPATSGNKYHYLNWAKEVVGVGDARVFPLWQGDNTVKVVIIDSDKQPASEELVEQVQEHIDPGIKGLGEGKAPIGAFCTVVSATSKGINVLVKITKDEMYSLNQIGLEIEENIIYYLKENAFKKTLVSYAHVGSIILDIEGVLDYTDLRVNGDIENIIVENEEVAVLGEVIISE